jgi:radical SAM superfamily enzyme YgiQ (UPF0313 family)
MGFINYNNNQQNMKPLKIYLGDLTYDTVSLSTEGFPLNIGYIAAYCIKRFNEKIDVKLFKYIDDLEEAILSSPPDVLGLGNYAWNHRISLEMFRILRRQNAYALTVSGCPNFPADIKSQEKFMSKYHEIDVYVPIEGEVGFSNIIEKALEANSKKEIRDTIFSKPIEGCITRDLEGRLQYSNPTIRMKNLDEIPSPYLTGLLDKFFDGRLSPMLQTNRGCPFQCSYCVDGNDSVRIVNRFSKERVSQEINYIAEHVPEKTKSMIISDLNFGMIRDDLETCKEIARAQEKYNYPLQITASTGKNSKERIVDAIKLVNGALRLWLSVQSTDPVVLNNVHRENMKIEQMLALQPSIREANLPTVSEVIIGLPGDSFESHINTIKDLVRAQVDEIQIYTLMLLDGTELNIPDERRKWGFKTKFRVLPRDFVKLRNGKKVLEIEEVVISSNSMSFEEYLEIRLLAFSIFVTNQIAFKPILKFLNENKIDVSELFYFPIKHKKETPNVIQQIFDKFKQSTIDELWDSPEDIEEHFQNDDEYKKLLNEELGFNVIQFYQAYVTRYFMDDWTNFIIEITKKLLEQKGIHDNYKLEQFKDIANYCRGLTYNPLELDKKFSVPEFVLSHNIESWLNSKTELPLDHFKLTSEQRIRFEYNEEDLKMIRSKIDIFGDSDVGIAQVLKRLSKKQLWRKPKPSIGFECSIQ